MCVYCVVGNDVFWMIGMVALVILLVTCPLSITQKQGRLNYLMWTNWWSMYRQPVSAMMCVWGQPWCMHDVRHGVSDVSHCWPWQREVTKYWSDWPDNWHWQTHLTSWEKKRKEKKDLKNRDKRKWSLIFVTNGTRLWETNQPWCTGIGLSSVMCNCLRRLLSCSTLLEWALLRLTSNPWSRFSACHWNSLSAWQTVSCDDQVPEQQTPTHNVQAELQLHIETKKNLTSLLRLKTSCKSILQVDSRKLVRKEACKLLWRTINNPTLNPQWQVAWRKKQYSHLIIQSGKGV